VISIGLTGGIGMGKSTAAEYLSKKGVPVIDTDDLARQVVEPGQPALEEVRAAFGPEVIGDDGHLLRDRLAGVVFGDHAKRKQLEAILHPRIRERWQAALEQWRQENRACGVVVIPLLFETAAEKCFDRIICVACSKATQQERVASRGWSAAQIEQRLAAQWPAEKKMAQSHIVIWTEGTLDVHAAQLDRILETVVLKSSL